MHNPGVQIIYTDKNPNESNDSPFNHVLVECPICQQDADAPTATAVHLDDMPTWREGKAAWRGDGALVSIPMSCEYGHLWEFCFGFHKGVTVAFIRNLEEIDYDEEGG